MATLNGRVLKLEAVASVATANLCRSCGLAHAAPRILLATVEASVRARLGTPPVRGPRLCLCDLCCGALEARMIARLTHGLSLREDAA